MMFRAGFILGLLLLLPYSGLSSQLAETSANPQNSPSNPTGVDVLVNNVDVKYTNSADEDTFKMFSSNFPIFNFNRPSNLYVIDGMVNVSSTLTITIENIGTAASGVIDVNVILLHNEYSYFEFVNQTTQMASLAGGSSNTVDVPLTPSYAGNHTLRITVTSTVSDDVPSNDVFSEPFTAGYDYFNCDINTAWTFGNGWTMSTDTSISKGRSCHAGNGQSSTYANNAMSVLTTPIMDLSDAVSNPTRTNGLSFYYTGSTAANDELTIYGRTALGGWSDIGSISGTVDQSFTDGANWQTFSVNNKGASSPLIPVAEDLFHRSSQFKFEFTSDAAGTDIGFYIDDIVIVYDQKVRLSDYNVSAQGVSTEGAIPGDWGKITMKIINTGNISERFIPSLSGLPAAWNAYYTRPSGTSFDPTEGLMVAPGVPSEFNIMVQPDINASIGFTQMTVDIVSQQYASVTTSLPVQFLVKADRIPVIQLPAVRPSCPPTYTCTFEVGLTNEGDASDVFDVGIDTSSLPSGWTVGLAWSQYTSVLIRPDETINLLMTMSPPQGVSPDTVVDFDLSLEAQNDSTRVDVKTIEIAASMTSVASVDLVEDMKSNRLDLDPGEQVVLEFEIWNNATRQDIFQMRVSVDGGEGWTVDQPSRPNAVLNAGGSTTFEVLVKAPNDARADEEGPSITPIIESQRSFMEIEGTSIDFLRIRTITDVALELVAFPSKLVPEQPNLVELRVVNLGNGPVDVLIEPDLIPESWTWWTAIEYQNLTAPHRLEASMDEGSTTFVQFWVHLPLSGPAGALNTIVITARDVAGVDRSQENNSVEFVSPTAAVRQPVLLGGQQSTSGIVGGIMFADVLLQNVGNALEDRLSVTATISSSPPVAGMVAFFTVDGATRSVGTPVELMLPAATSQTLRLEVLIPEDTPLNTRFVLRFAVDGALDQDGLPVEMVHEALVMVNQRRSMELDVQRDNPRTLQYGDSGRIWVNHTSTSTMTESYVLSIASPDGWQVTCDNRLVNQTGTQYELTPGHVEPQKRQHICEVLRLSGSLEGTVQVMVTSEDGVLLEQTAVSFTHLTAPEPEGISSVVVIASGLAGVFLVVALMAMLMRSNRGMVHDDELQPNNEQPNHTGPPASTSAHPEQVRTDPSETITQASTGQPESPTAIHQGPPLPAEGLPPGWTMEQWTYYGQQYLDGTLG